MSMQTTGNDTAACSLLSLLPKPISDAVDGLNVFVCIVRANLPTEIGDADPHAVLVVFRGGCIRVGRGIAPSLEDTLK